MKRKLNLGCGIDIRPDYLNVDINKGKGVDKTFNFDKIPYPLPDNQFDEVYVDNVLEHLTDLPAVINELHRICRNKAIIIIKVPYYNCKGAYDDPTHQHYFNRDTLAILAGEQDRPNLRVQQFKVVRIRLIPTILGRLFIFPKLIHTMSLIFGEVVSEVHATIQVTK